MNIIIRINKILCMILKFFWPATAPSWDELGCSFPDSDRRNLKNYLFNIEIIDVWRLWVREFY